MDMENYKLGILNGLERLNNNKEKKESAKSTELNVIQSKEIEQFDYNSVDADTAEYLHAKAKEIIRMRLVFTISMANVLEDVHERLANHYKGTFGKWCESIGISDRTARNYLSVLRWSRENFPNIEDAEKIQPSLLFAISKPSAPVELQDMVLSGDITTHKQYKELEEKLNAAEKEAQENQRLYVTVSQNYDRLEKANHNYYEKEGKLEKELEKVKQQLLEAQASGNSEEVEKLNILLEDTVRELEASKDKIEELEEQLNDNTEIATAVVEKVPDEIYEELEELREHNLSAEINAELKSILKNFNKEVMGLALVLCKFKDKHIGTDCIKIINEIRTNMIQLKSVSNQNLKKDLFDFIKD